MPTPLSTARQPRIQPVDACPAGVAIAPGHVGLVSLPGTGRTVWWTGRVAIGLRHEASHGASRAVSSSALWIQSLLLGSPRSATPAA
jgi:hypothetical protein